MSKQPNGQAVLHPALQGDGFDLVLAGERVDGRTAVARRFKQLGNDLTIQLGGVLAPAERMLITNAAALAVLCERDAAVMLQGNSMDEEGYRRNVQALSAVLIKLGLAKKSRDVTKGDNRMFDSHAAAILDVE